MPKLTRYLQKIFANNSNQVGVFGTGVDKETSKNVETLQSADYEEGWSSAIITNKNYPIWQEMDGVQYGLSYQLKYLFQNGIPEWLSTETYYTNSYCRVGSNVYYSLQDDNTNHNPALNDGWWTPLLTSSRSIGEIVPSCVPLTDAGLHLLDGTLIQGNGVYSDFVSYMSDLYNTTAKTYKPSAFTVVGSPTITSDGIASGFGSSNYLTVPLSISAGQSFNIKSRYTLGSDLTGTQLLYELKPTDSSLDTGNWRPISIRPVGGGKFFVVYPTSATTASNFVFSTTQVPIVAGQSYDVNISVAGTTFSVTVNGETITKTDYYPYAITTSKLGVDRNKSNALKGSLDLKEFSITVNGTQVFSGSERAGFCLESEWQQSVTNYGVCSNFVYEPSSNTVRLPKYNSKIYTGGGTSPVVGNGMTLGLTNGSQNFGMVAGTNGAMIGYTGLFGANTGTAKSGTPITADKGYGVTTDGTKSGLIANLSDITTSLDCYYYIVVATSIKTDIEVDIDEIATDLNGKADVDLTNVNDTGYIKMAGASMPSSVYTNLTLGASGTTYTAPANGYFAVSKVAGANSYYVSIVNQNSGIRDSREVASTSFCTPCVAVKKNDVVKITYNATGTLNYFVFVYAVGSESEA